MEEIARLHPRLTLDHVSVVARDIAEQRNAVRKLNRPFLDAHWGLGCMYYDWSHQHLKQVAHAGAHSWLKYINGLGNGYAISIDGVPLRIQKDEPDVRDVLPGERAALQLLLMPGHADPTTILRLEVSQPPGRDVETITLCLFNEATKALLDSEVVYRAPAARAARTARNAPGVVLTLGRRPQDTDPKKRFTFDNADVAAQEGDDSKE